MTSATALRPTMKILRSTLLLVLAVRCLSAQPLTVDPEIPAYAKVPGISGSLSSIGSDTLNNMMTLWAEGFRKHYPSVRIQVEGKGSATAVPALVTGTAQFGPMSRTMKSSEVDEFERKWGYKPTLVVVALDGLALYVHKDNPLEHLTMAQVDAIFSRTRRGGFAEDLALWGQVGLTSEWAERPISLYGRNSVSGTYGFFKETALFKGDFKDAVKEQPGSAAVVQNVGRDVGGIGYSGIGYRTSDVRPLRIGKSPEGPFLEPSYETVTSGQYALGRALFVYINKAPNKAVEPLTRQFLTFALSREGQQLVIEDGYLPLPAARAKKSLDILR